jgi:hypothetical protein
MLLTQETLPKSTVRLSLWLFGKPAWEIERLEGSDVDVRLLDEIAQLGEEFSARLKHVSEIGRKLLNAGWDGYGLLYDLDFMKDITLEEAKAELKALGIDENEVSLTEEEIEEDEV